MENNITNPGPRKTAISGMAMVLLIVLLPIFGLWGCAAGKDIAKEFETIQAEACACKDKPCAEKVFQRFQAAYKANKNEKVGSNAYSRIQKASSETGICLIKNGLSIEVLKFAKDNAKK